MWGHTDSARPTCLNWKAVAPHHSEGARDNAAELRNVIASSEAAMSRFLEDGVKSPATCLPARNQTTFFLSIHLWLSSHPPTPLYSFILIQKRKCADEVLMCETVAAPTHTHHGELNAAGVRVGPNLAHANMHSLQHPGKQRQATAGIHNPLFTPMWMQR